MVFTKTSADSLGTLSMRAISPISMSWLGNPGSGLKGMQR